MSNRQFNEDTLLSGMMIDNHATRGGKRYSLSYNCGTLSLPNGKTDVVPEGKLSAAL